MAQHAKMSLDEVMRIQSEVGWDRSPPLFWEMDGMDLGDAAVAQLLGGWVTRRFTHAQGSLSVGWVCTGNL